jgi:predicted metal-binding protein
MGIIACGKNWRKGCPGLCSHVLCFEALAHKAGPFKQLGEDSELISIVPCTGCPGDSILQIAEQMVTQEKVEIIVFPYCIIYNSCPGLAEKALEIQKKYNCTVVLGNYPKYSELLAYLQPPHKCCWKEQRVAYA